MTNHWAIAVGINHYQFLQPLYFAQQDAQSLCESLVSDAGFLPDRCLLINETSPDLAGHSTDPNRENLLHWIEELRGKLQAEEGLWCFFSGYGVCVNGEDYLLSIDADPAQVDETGISVRSFFETLKNLPTDNILVLLDINRAQSVSNEKVGTQTADLAREYGIPTLLSCRPEQFSHESSLLNHGLFTQALLEGLRSHQCSTLASLEEFMKSRLPELCDHNDRPAQDPVLVVSDPEQLYRVIMPVDWSKTESWTPAAEANPFAVEGDFYLSPTDSSDVALSDFDSFASHPIMGATAPSIYPDPDPIDPPPVRPDPGAEIPLPDPTPQPEPEPDIPLVPNEPEPPNQLLWEKILFGGSALLFVLLLGVLFRNWSTFVGGSETAKKQAPAAVTNAATQSPAVTPKKSTSSARTGATPPTKSGAAPQSSAQILNDARSIIKPALASDASRAIDRASLIPPGDPLYAQAQQDIDRWSRSILEIARTRAANGEFRQAIAAAQLVPKGRPQVYAEAQKAIQQWKPRVR